MVIKQYDFYLINLDPTLGHEIKKTRPCMVLSPDEMNRNLATVMIAPMTTVFHNYPTRVPIKLKNRSGWIVLDQIRTVDKKRLIKKLGHANQAAVAMIKSIIKEMLID